MLGGHDDRNYENEQKNNSEIYEIFVIVKAIVSS